MSYEGLQAEVVSFKAHNGDSGEAYYARPTRAGKVPGIVVIMHLPGWDEWIIRGAQVRPSRLRGDRAASLFPRRSRQPRRHRGAGAWCWWRPDAQVMGDVAGSIAYLRAQPNASGKVGVIGFCSGGRHAYLAGCSLSGIDAVVDCWGGNVVVSDPKLLDAKRPVAPST
jgi:carboxymethylenebutenolidase